MESTYSDKACCRHIMQAKQVDLQSKFEQSVRHRTKRCGRFVVGIRFANVESIGSMKHSKATTIILTLFPSSQSPLKFSAPSRPNGESRVCGIFFGWIMIAVHPAAARAVSFASFLFLPSAMSHQTIVHLCIMKTNGSESGSTAHTGHVTRTMQLYLVYTSVKEY